MSALTIHMPNVTTIDFPNFDESVPDITPAGQLSL
jgi:hypothetical protein